MREFESDQSKSTTTESSIFMANMTTYTLEPCDKVATLYVMQQKFDTPDFDSLDE